MLNRDVCKKCHDRFFVMGLDRYWSEYERVFNAGVGLIRCPQMAVKRPYLVRVGRRKVMDDCPYALEHFIGQKEWRKT